MSLVLFLGALLYSGALAWRHNYGTALVTER